MNQIFESQQTLTGELWGACFEDFGENRPRYKGPALYLDLKYSHVFVYSYYRVKHYIVQTTPNFTYMVHLRHSGASRIELGYAAWCSIYAQSTGNDTSFVFCMPITDLTRVQNLPLNTRAWHADVVLIWLTKSSQIRLLGKLGTKKKCRNKKTFTGVSIESVLQGPILYDPFDIWASFWCIYFLHKFIFVSMTLMAS